MRTLDVPEDQGSYLIGFFCDTPMIGSGYFAMLQVGLIAACRRWKCSLMVEAFDFSEADPSDQISRLLSRWPLRGVVIPEPMCDRQDVLELLTAAGLPIVRIAPHRDTSRTFDICIDHRQAAFDVTRYLIGLGHTRIGFIKGPTDHGDANVRFDGFCSAMVQSGLPVVPELCVPSLSFDYSSGIPAAQQLLSITPRPTAVFACNDELAAAFLATATGLGLKIPDDISLAGFDDAPLARIVRPQLTTCRQKMELTGYNAIDFIMNPPTSPEAFRRSQPHELVIRESTAPPKS
jgi:LacI family transcriptional regulator